MFGHPICSIGDGVHIFYLFYLFISPSVLLFYSLQCFDTVGWASGRASGLQKLTDEVLVWLSVWNEVQIVCIWSS